MKYPLTLRQSPTFWFAVVVFCTFCWHWSFLNRGFFADDFAFFGDASQGFYGSRVHSLLDIAAFWNPARGWFYRPAFLSYMALCTALWGHNAWPYHAMGLLLDASVIFLLGALVWRMTANRVLAVVCGGAFLLWPGKSEAVWWIASHSALLAALFSLLSLHCWLNLRDTRKTLWYWLSLASFWLALCSKFDAVSLMVPLAMLLFGAPDARPKISSRAVLSGLPFALALLIYLACE